MRESTDQKNSKYGHFSRFENFLHMSLEKCFRKIIDQINLFHVTDLFFTPWEHRKGYRKRPVAKELIKNRHKKNGFDFTNRHFSEVIV